MPKSLKFEKSKAHAMYPHSLAFDICVFALILSDKRGAFCEALLEPLTKHRSLSWAQIQDIVITHHALHLILFNIFGR